MVAGFEVLNAVVMRTSVFWDIISCSPRYSTDNTIVYTTRLMELFEITELFILLYTF
jgi:hypothetical protein